LVLVCGAKLAAMIEHIFYEITTSTVKANM